ncbi:MAG: PPC domain-containing protein, partial [Opitutaceae bacterium]
LRVRTATGVSALRMFFVGPFDAIDEREPNDKAATAQKVALNTTVQGTLAAEDEDWFAVDAAAGQRISAEVEGARLGRTMLDPVLVLRDPAGRVLAKSDDTPLLGHDAHLSLIAPVAGTYTLQLRDAVYSGSHAYRLHIGDFPRPAVVFPPGGQVGSPLAVRFLGGAGEEAKREITLPAVPAERFAVAPAAGETPPTPNWLRVSSFPNAPAAEAGRTRETAAKIEASVPFAFNGIVAGPEQPAFVRFAARKDQHLEFQVIARRLGSPLDPVVTVFGPKGNTLGSNDDAAGHPDSSVRVRIPEDAEYTVRVADQLGHGGPLHVYRLEVTEVAPSVALKVPDTARYDYETRKSIVVPRGNRFALLLNVTRDGYNGDLRLRFDGLPAGITAEDCVEGSGVSAVPVVFSAASNAVVAGNLLQPRVEPVKQGEAAVRSSFRHTVDWVRIQNDTVYVRSEVDRIAAAVVEAVPYQVSIAAPKVPLVQSGEIELAVTAARDAGFEEPITVKLLWSPPGVSALPEIVIPKGKTEVAYKLSSTVRAETRRSPLVVVASATVKGGAAWVASPAVPLEVAPAFLTGRMELAKVEQGKTGRMVCTLEVKTPFEGEAEVRLAGLPEGVSAAPVMIRADSREVVFEVTRQETFLFVPTALFSEAVTSKTASRLSARIITGAAETPSGRPARRASASPSKGV